MKRDILVARIGPVSAKFYTISLYANAAVVMRDADATRPHSWCDGDAIYRLQQDKVFSLYLALQYLSRGAHTLGNHMWVLGVSRLVRS